MENALPKRPETASIARRLAALVIDCVLVAGAAAAITRPEPPRLTSAVVLLVYYPFFTGFFRQTIGMRLLGIACVRANDGGLLGFGRALLRTVLLQFVVPAVFINKDGQGLHDRAARSLVIRTRRVR